MLRSCIIGTIVHEYTMIGLQPCRALTATICLLVQPGSGFSVPFCVPPEVPSVPATDADLRAYADLISADYEEYFRAVSDFTTCLTEARAEVIVEAEEAGVQYRRFLQRADHLGKAELAATPHSTAGRDAYP